MNYAALSDARLYKLDSYQGASGALYLFLVGVCTIASIVTVVGVVRAALKLQDYTLAKWAGVTAASALGGILLFIPIALMLNGVRSEVEQREAAAKRRVAETGESTARPLRDDELQLGVGHRVVRNLETGRGDQYNVFLSG